MNVLFESSIFFDVSGQLPAGNDLREKGFILGS